MSAEDKPKLSKEELGTLIKHYDSDKSGKLDDAEIVKLVEGFKKNPKGVPSEVRAILLKYDTDGSGSLDAREVKELVTDIYRVDKDFRFAGYSAAFARAFRYLAFTSDVGEALRPVLRNTIVTATYGVAAAYCVADVAYETYKVKQTGKNPQNHPCTPVQMLVERATFQLVASLIVPAVIIHSAVDMAKMATRKMGRFQRWGPSVFGLAIIPLLPMYLDEPAEHAVEYMFEHYGPWASKKKHE
jgi:mitochondrial fission process protein 1